MVPSPERLLHLRAQTSPRLMLLVRANSMAMPSGRGPPLPGASCGCGRHGRGHLSASSCAWTACRSRRDSWDGVLAATTARAGYFAPFSNEAVGPLGALAACRDRDAVERRLGGARGLPGLRTPRVSAEGTLAGRPLVVFVALAPAAWLRRRTRGGDRAPRAGGPPPPRVRGHREAARHLRQARLQAADHVITLREFRMQIVPSLNLRQPMSKH